MKQLLIKRLAAVITGLGLSLGLSLSAHAQGMPNEGIEYLTLPKAIAPAVASKKVEVIEFFWYGCPHCNSFEPELANWVKKSADKVNFKRVHINFGQNRTEAHQKLFYAMEQMGITEKHHLAIFAAIHGERRPLNTRDSIMSFMKDRGVDAAKFGAAYDSFGATTAANNATKLQNDFRVDGVPYVGIGGLYTTSPTMAGGSRLGALGVMDFLVAKVSPAPSKPAAKPAASASSASKAPAVKPSAAPSK